MSISVPIVNANSYENGEGFGNIYEGDKFCFVGTEDIKPDDAGIVSKVVGYLVWPLSAKQEGGVNLLALEHDGKGQPAVIPLNRMKSLCRSRHLNEAMEFSSAFSQRVSWSIKN